MDECDQHHGVLHGCGKSEDAAGGVASAGISGLGGKRVCA